jgi:quinol monooxygenase YgiN
MHTRLFFGEIQPGKTAEASQVLEEFAVRARQQKGFVLNQVLQNGNELVGISTWETIEDLASYADGPLATDLFKRITPLLMGMPTVKTFEVKRILFDPAVLKPS